MFLGSLFLALLFGTTSAAAEPVDFPCATAVSHWSPPIYVSRDALRASRARGLALGSFNIVIQAGAGLASNAAALAAWERAAGQWEAIIADPVTVRVSANLVAISEPGVLGQTDAVLLTGDVDEIRDAMAAAAAFETDDGVTAALPTAAQLSLLLAPGDVFLGTMIATKANLKALGFTGLDSQFGARDATIDFNSAFAFDFDRSNGITPGTIDFESVAAHELGHVLGFVSGVDFLDQGSLVATPMPLDLFRFPNGTADDPTTTGEFTTAGRSMRPGSNDVFDDLGVEYRFSTGFSQGDGRQASHWKDDALTGVYIGLMDASLSPRTTLELTGADARAVDVIGWDVGAGGTTTSLTSTTSTSTTTLLPECTQDATCVDADPCTRDYCSNPICAHIPIVRPVDAGVLVPIVAGLDGCGLGSVPSAIEKRARQLRGVLQRAEKARNDDRMRTLLDRAGKKVDRVLLKATSFEGKGKLTVECGDALEARMDEIRIALACVIDAS